MRFTHNGGKAALLAATLLSLQGIAAAETLECSNDEYTMQVSIDYDHRTTRATVEYYQLKDSEGLVTSGSEEDLHSHRQHIYKLDENQHKNRFSMMTPADAAPFFTFSVKGDSGFMILNSKRENFDHCYW